MQTRTAVLLGGSGLVGAQLLTLLAADASYSAIAALTRRPLGIATAKVREIVVDFEKPETLRPHVAVSDVFCCLGTTIKKAGSQAAFRKVDFDAPMAVARESRAAGASRFILVTAVGASVASAIIYNQVKGEVEDALRALAFPGGVRIIRPSLLLGDRAESRPAERVAAALMRATRPLFAGGLARYRAIEAGDVARAMLAAARQDEGDEVYEGERLFALARIERLNAADPS